MITFIISAIKIIFLLGFLIFIHEGGHFLVAKLCKIKVNEFAIGFGPTIWKKQGKIKDFFGGDRWNMSDHTALEILKSDKTIYNDEDFNKFNPGITIIVVN